MFWLGASIGLLIGLCLRAAVNWIDDIGRYIDREGP